MLFEVAPLVASIITFLAFTGGRKKKNGRRSVINPHLPVVPDSPVQGRLPVVLKTISSVR